ncbi:MAG: carbohydrate ABC transporter permease [Clostridia bacterium]|nr:carbohydrate ABC transporter permease [Clostridia bacterium]
MTRTSKNRITRKIVLSVILFASSVIMLYPLVYMLLGALADNDQMYLNASFLPKPYFTADRIKNFTIVFEADDFTQSIFITFARIGFYAVINVLFSTMAGYIFSKMEFKGKKIVFLYLMSSMMIPGVAVMVPSYILLNRFPLVGGNDILGAGGMGFRDNPAVLFVTGWVPVYNMFLMRQSFNSFGSEMKEAAMVDGANHFLIMFVIYMPLALPCLAVMLIGMVIGFWNDYMTCLIYLPDLKGWHTIGTKIIDIIDLYGAGGNGVPYYSRIYGISFMFILPPIVVFLIFQRFFISGLAMGAVKG